jgi:hypothetical protein
MYKLTGQAFKTHSSSMPPIFVKLLGPATRLARSKIRLEEFQAGTVQIIEGGEPMQNDQEHFFSDIFLNFIIL